MPEKNNRPKQQRKLPADFDAFVKRVLAYKPEKGKPQSRRR